MILEFKITVENVEGIMCSDDTTYDVAQYIKNALNQAFKDTNGRDVETRCTVRSVQ